MEISESLNPWYPWVSIDMNNIKVNVVIFSAFAEPGEKTVIPACVTGKFSIRLVPSMTTEHVEKCVVDHVMKIHESLGTKNKIKCGMMKGPSVPWVTDPNNENFTAAREAIKAVRGVEPDLTREGCSIPGLVKI